MNRLGTIITACIAGLIVGLCAALLVVPRLVSRANDTQTITATVLDHGQGATRESAARALSNSNQQKTSAAKEVVDVFPSSVTDELLSSSFAAKLNLIVKPGTRVLLVPHHLVAAREIASLLAATPKPSKVYLVVPDHFSACKCGLCSINLPAFLMVGEKCPDLTIEQIKGEHAITGLVPFLRRAWGKTVPVAVIMMRPDLKAEDAQSVTQSIVQIMKDDPNALLVVSIDGSHYLPVQVADFHDVLTQDVIQSVADKEVEKTEIDAPAVLRVGLKVARELGLGDVTIQAHTNSLRILKAEISQESTSHFIASFAPGTIEQQDSVTLLAVGDVMLDRNVATRIQKSGVDNYTFQKILGLENRFFRGQDVLVGNLEGPIGTKRAAPDKGNVDFLFDPKFVQVLKKVGFDAVSQANNHVTDQGSSSANASRQALEFGGLAVFGDQYSDNPNVSLKIVERRGKKIALVGFDVISKALDREAAGASLTQARAAADYVVVMPHWGAEYQSKPGATQVDLAHWFIDNGADAVIGGHPHWMQSVEVYKGHLIAYSLGNFVFDQDWSQETGLGLVVGLVLSKSSSELYLYPIKIEKSQPRLLNGKDKQIRLDYLAGISDESLSSQIKNGVIKLINN